MERKKLKRIKKVYDCPNPLFEQWLTELRDEAARRRQKTQYIYQKALASLKKYPLPLKSGKECRILEFFGDKICQILDEKLAKHRAENGNTSGSNIENGSNNDGGFCVSESPKRQRKTKERPYVPLPRSGSYAILLTLYHHMEKYGRKSYLKKSEIIEAAQHLCDKSFKVPDPGGFYTAWNSMGLLIRKGLVIKESSPAKYYLTESGINTTELLIVGQQSSQQKIGKSKTTSKKSSSHSSSQSSTPSDFHSSQSNDNLPSTSDDRSEYMSSQSSVTSNAILSMPLQPLSRLKYCYVSDKGELVSDKNKASVIINDEISVGFLIKCKKLDLLNSGKVFVIDHLRPSKNGFVFAYLSDNYAQERSPLSPDYFLKDFENTPELTKPKDGCIDSSRIVKKSLHTVTSVSSSVPERLTSENNSLQSGIHSFSSIFKLYPGNFEVVLCIDNAETLTGASNPRKMMIQHDLRKNVINFAVRKFDVGDFAWVAREKVKPIPGRLELPRAQELILDFIVERKRLDDLAGSIKDGRFHEQKFRLKTCGLRRPIYLVEGMGNSSYAKHFSIPESSLKQAVANTQIIDGFTVKHTNDHAESVMYLTLMTRYLQSFYSNKILISCSKEELPSEMPTGLCSDCKLMNFEEFNSSSTKVREMTVKEIFAKQLLQLSGLSVEKALAIVEKYPTIAILLSAYEDCMSESEKEKMLSGIKFGAAKRNIGPSISKVLYKLYCHTQV